jgi:hypothetical protein
MIKLHRQMPFHHLEVRTELFALIIFADLCLEKWDGTLFQRCGFKSLGLRIQLGHPPDAHCPNPVASAGDDFVIMNTHTIDEISLDYCGCGRSEPRAIQLLRMRLYPATGTNPRSAATFATLERFDLLSLESKCSAYEFYNSLQRGTDNTGIAPVRVRLPYVKQCFRF